jgi:hypothetical protein
VVAITGTNGKSTTTALVAHILDVAGLPVTMGGNIGLPILGQTPLAPNDRGAGVYVLELSSYQIDLTQRIDADVAEFPPDVLQSLLAARRDIVVPNVVMAPGGRSYDLNSWRARELGDNASLAAVAAHHDALHAAESRAGRPHALHLEGYGGGGAHIYLHQMRGGGGGGGAAVRRLDAVGGAMLLVNAELHRHGLIFPPFVYRHRIETEGLSMMALDMGVLSWGMPAIEVIHH